MQYLLKPNCETFQILKIGNYNILYVTSSDISELKELPEDEVPKILIGTKVLQDSAISPVLHLEVN